MVSLLRSALTAHDVLSGVSELPNGCGAAVKLLGRGSKPVQAALRAAWNAASRVELLRTPGPEPAQG